MQVEAKSLAGIPAIPPRQTGEMRKNIRIENPVTGNEWTTRKRARQYVASGRAEWVRFGEVIRFQIDNHQTCSVRREHDETSAGYDRAAGIGMATLTQLANLPMVAPAAFLGIGKRKGATRHAFVATQGL